MLVFSGKTDHMHVYRLLPQPDNPNALPMCTNCPKIALQPISRFTPDELHDAIDRAGKVLAASADRFLFYCSAITTKLIITNIDWRHGKIIRTYLEWKQYTSLKLPWTRITFANTGHRVYLSLFQMCKWRIVALNILSNIILTSRLMLRTARAEKKCQEGHLWLSFSLILADRYILGRGS